MRRTQPDPENPAHVKIAWDSPAGWGWWATGGEYQYPRHIRAMDDAARRCAVESIRLLFESPPQHGKTWFLRFLCGWYFGKFPDRSIMYAAHTQRLVDRIGRMVREDIDRAGRGLFGISVAEGTRAKADFLIVDEGGRTSGGGEFFGLGGGGSPHGRGANLLLTDDLIPNAEAARSDVQLEALEDFLRHDLLSRRRGDFSHVGIQTRWSERDPHGILTTIYPDLYQVLRLPALAEEGDPLGRAPGEALWPEAHPLAELQEQRAGMHPYRWAALYQQRPSPDEGGLWRRSWWAGRTFRLEYRDGERWIRDHAGTRIPLRECIRFVVLDLATTTKRTSDPTAILACALTPERPRRLVLLDLDMRRMEAPEINPSVSRMVRRWACAVAYYETQGNQAWGQQYAVRDGIPARSIGTARDCDVRIPGDKSAVVYNGSPVVAQGRLLVPADASWVAEWEHQLLVFPNGRHDECSDVTAWACHVALQVGQGSLVLDYGGAAREAPRESERDRFRKATIAAFDADDAPHGGPAWRGPGGEVDLDRYLGT